MTSITYVGMDVHTTNYTLCCYGIENDTIFATVQVAPHYDNIVKYLKKVKENSGYESFLCGYEAGCLGYSLYHQLKSAGINCVILAPTSMPRISKNEIKTDKRDAAKIAKCLAYNTYSPVYVPDDEDNAVKEYIRLRDSQKDALKRIKQQINAFCTRYGKAFEGKSKWTRAHICWLEKLEFDDGILQETFKEYLMLYSQAVSKLKVFDERIAKLADKERYADNVKKLRCLIGVETHTAMAIISETGDFKRFKSARQYAAYLGLVPGETSSGNMRCRTGITKAGNTHIRILLTESAQCYSRGSHGIKTKALAEKQSGNSSEVISYADKANERLRRKFRKILTTSKRNIAVTAVARELSCFIWGLMTDNIA